MQLLTDTHRLTDTHPYIYIYAYIQRYKQAQMSSKAKKSPLLSELRCFRNNNKSALLIELRCVKNINKSALLRQFRCVKISKRDLPPAEPVARATDKQNTCNEWRVRKKCSRRSQTQIHLNRYL